MKEHKIRNYFQRLICVFASVALLIPAITSCHSSYARNKSIVSAPKKIPHMAFVFVTVRSEIKPVGCSPKEKKKDCQEFISKLPTVNTGSVGSGIIVEHENLYGVLTAAHVCKQPEIKETSYKNYQIILSKKDKIYIEMQNGKKELSEILLINDKDDLCLLKKKKSDDLPAVKVATKEPQRSDRVYNIAAPYGITGNNLTLIFEGYFSGTSGNWFYYTLPARPGSSGSAVLNERYELIGTLNVAVRNFENVGLGSGLKQIKNFLKRD